MSAVRSTVAVLLTLVGAGAALVAGRHALRTSETPPPTQPATKPAPERAAKPADGTADGAPRPAKLPATRPASPDEQSYQIFMDLIKSFEPKPSKGEHQ